MNLDPYIAVSGLPGVYRMITNRSNGLVIGELDSEKTKFCTIRKHQFTPLGTVAIYTLSDTVELSIVFQRMLDQYAEMPPPNNKAGKDDYFEYFDQIIPDYDEDRVFVNDMKKIIKWFNFLNERGLLVQSDEEE